MPKASEPHERHRQLVLDALDHSIASGMYAPIPLPLIQRIDELTRSIAVDPDMPIEGEVDL